MASPSNELPPSSWVVRFAPNIAAGSTVLDLAAGGGRHSRFLLERGHPVVAVDREITKLEGLRSQAEIVAADLENGSPWPLGNRRFGGVVVTNYLHRPLFPALLAALTSGGILIYETFAAGNERFGKPRNPEFLLQPGELLDAVRGRLRVLAYEDVEISEPRPAMVQRIAAIAP
jgi:SAM-dependent methyltransferase